MVEESGILKRKSTPSMYSLAELTRPAQFHRGRPSLAATQMIRDDEASLPAKESNLEPVKESGVDDHSDESQVVEEKPQKDAKSRYSFRSKKN
jgi:hypothetical protein